MTFYGVRAAILHGKEDLRIEDIVPRPLQPGEVRVAIAAALTCGTDLKVYRRGYHARMGVPPFPFGHEWSGTVSEVAPDVGGWSVGDRVVAANSAPCGVCPSCRRQQESLCDDLLFLNGAYADSIVVPARIVSKNLLRVPGDMGWADAALTEPLACVVQGIEDVGVGPGDRLLVLGAGPIGLMAVALARHAGAEVAVIGRGPARLDQARRLGAGTVHENLAPDRIDAPAGTEASFDVVFEAMGRPFAWEAAVRLVHKGGRVNWFGGCPSGTTVQVDTVRMHYDALTLKASFHHTPRTIRRALQLVHEGVVTADVFVDGRRALSDLPGLFREMAQGNRAVKTWVDVKA
ncbi:MAG: alcohol dehydrogenase catalytic domain-containing protein [Verrucomicrobiota bacterium]